MPSSLPPLLALVGPTASGKTALAIALSAQFPIEIISMDSALVYRDMDIGTAKPTPEERAAVPHHLIDICTPLEPYSAAQFVADTHKAAALIHSRGRIPLLVGGTFLYLNVLLNGMSTLPAADAAYRAELDDYAEKHGWAALHERLLRYDPLSAQRIEVNDRQRIQRALEVLHITGRPLSEAHTERTGTLQYTPIVLGLNIERAILHSRIGQRFRIMVECGLLNEVRHLQQHYPDLHADLPSMRCVGYRQAWDHLAGMLSSTEWIERGIIATRQLAKRQITWMRHFPTVPIHSFEATSPQVLDHLTDFIANSLSNVENPE